MKFVLILLLICVTQTFASDILSQKPELNLSNKEAALQQILDEIEKQTSLRFLYHSETVENKIVKIDIKNKSWYEILEQIKEASDVDYRILEDYLIVLTPLKHAQPITITGTVINEETGEPLIGVNIVVKGTTKGTITNVNGTYTISVDDPEVILVFSFVGYQSKEVPVNNRTVIDVALTLTTELLDEIVIIGYGTVRKSDLTGSVSSLRGDAITATSSANPITALQGRASGVQVVEAGDPGTAPSIKIRGIGTTNNSEPLFIVDGMMFDNIQFLSSNDIESLEVLKDASATAIYGSRGANGVILITTKKGQSRTPSFTFTMYEGIEHPHEFNTVTGSEYAMLINEGYKYIGEPEPYANPESFGVGTQWFKEVTRNAPVRDYQLSFNQNSENASYYVSVGIHDNNGIVVMDKSEYRRYTIRSNNEYRLFKNISIGHNLTGISSKKQVVNPDHTWAWLYRVKPTVPVYDAQGNYNDVEEDSNGNVVADLDFRTHKVEFIGLLGNAYLNIDFLKNFRFRSSIGIDISRTQSLQFIPVYQVGTGVRQSNNISTLNKEWGSTNNWLWENTITYDQTFGSHHINVLGGITAQNNYYENISGYRRNLFADDPSLWYFNAGAPEGQTNNNTASSNSMMSYLFRGNYSFARKYLLTGTFRADGSSKFPESGRWGYFPSVALGWRISEENFMQDLTWLSELKLRGSWGLIGNDKIGDYRYYALASTGSNYAAVFNDKLQLGATVTSLVNSVITWEKSEQINFGVEFGLLDNRLSGEVDWYKKTTTDMLVAVGVPRTVGLSTTEGNVGAVKNHGLDIILSFRNSHGDFTYDISVNASTINNEVLDLGGREFLQGGYIGPIGNISRATVGDPIGYWIGYISEGVFQNQDEIDAWPTMSNVTPGDLKFQDNNGYDSEGMPTGIPDGKIDAADRTVIGVPIPDAIGGLNLMLGYKGFELAVDMYGSFGQDIFNCKDFERYSGNDNFSKEFLDRWHGEGTSNRIPKITFGGDWNFEPNSRWVYKGSFVKLQHVRLAYNLPSSLLQKIRMKSARIYLSGDNLHYFSSYPGSTPEISGSPMNAGIDRYVYPVASVYKIGVTVIF